MNYTPGPWYVANRGGDQGLVISEENGANVAVTYDRRDAPVVALAPRAARALRFCVEALDVEAGGLYPAHIEEARAILREIDGEGE